MSGFQSLRRPAPPRATDPNIRSAPPLSAIGVGEKRLLKREVPARPGSKRSAVARCLEIHELVLSKLVPGRERGWDYAAEALKAGLVQPDVLLARVPDLPAPEQLRAHIRKTLRGIIASL